MNLHVCRAALGDVGPRPLRSGIYTMLSRKLSLLQEMASVVVAHGGQPWSQCRFQDYIDAGWLVQRLCTSSILLSEATAAACNNLDIDLYLVARGRTPQCLNNVQGAISAAWALH